MMLRARRFRCWMLGHLWNTVTHDEQVYIGGVHKREFVRVTTCLRCLRWQ